MQLNGSGRTTGKRLVLSSLCQVLLSSEALWEMAKFLLFLLPTINDLLIYTIHGAKRVAGGRRKKKARDYSSSLVVGPCSILIEKLSLPLLGALGRCTCRQAKVFFHRPIVAQTIPLVPCLPNLIDIQERHLIRGLESSPIGRPGIHLPLTTVGEDHLGLGEYGLEPQPSTRLELKYTSQISRCR